MRFLRGAAPYGGMMASYVDSWATINPNDPGLTFSSSNPDRRIDYIYVVPGTATQTTVLGCEKIFDRAVNGTFASDHIGVICRYSVR